SGVLGLAPARPNKPGRDLIQIKRSRAAGPTQSGGAAWWRSDSIPGASPSPPAPHSVDEALKQGPCRSETKFVEAGKGMLKWIAAFLFVLTAAIADSLAARELVDINSATLEELETLPGIGVGQSANILANRPYNTIDELVQRGIISKTRFAKIRNAIT